VAGKAAFLDSSDGQDNAIFATSDVEVEDMPDPQGFQHPAQEAYPVKSGERLAAELQAILDGGCLRVQVCSFNDVLSTPEAAAVFRRYFGDSVRRPTEKKQHFRMSTCTIGDASAPCIRGRRWR